MLLSMLLQMTLNDFENHFQLLGNFGATEE